MAPFISLFACCLATGTSASAYCPGAIATIEGTPMNTVLLPVMESLYQQLDCDLEAVPYPGRRGIAAFNAKTVSGELFRLPVIEPSYETEFVRSAAPVFELEEAVWMHPAKSLTETSKIGYVVGRRWQETHAASNTDHHRFIEYFNTEDLISDYERGSLDGFLSGPLQVDTLAKKHKFSSKPEMAKLIRKTPVYHYLQAEFSDFMADFSRLLATQPKLHQAGKNL